MYDVSCSIRSYMKGYADDLRLNVGEVGLLACFWLFRGCNTGAQAFRGGGLVWAILVFQFWGVLHGSRRQS